MMFGVHICNIDNLLHRICVINFYFIQQSTSKTVLVLFVIIYIPQLFIPVVVAFCIILLCDFQIVFESK